MNFSVFDGSFPAGLLVLALSAVLGVNATDPLAVWKHTWLVVLALSPALFATLSACAAVKGRREIQPMFRLLTEGPKDTQEED